MNERINELAGQALSELAIAGWDLQTSPFNLFTDRFAELIVRECASLFEDDLRPMGDFTERACRRAIKEHFGVEE